MSAHRITATYRIETACPLMEAIETMAGEQSTGTFIRLPGETDAMRDAYGAHIEQVTELEPVGSPSLPGAGSPRDGAAAGGTPLWRRAEVVLSWSLENCGPSLPNLLATVAGNLFELRPFSGLRILDIALPEAFAAAYPGPRFGVAGTRRLAGVEQGPLIGTIVKPSVGLGPQETAEVARTLCAAGIDFIKDDELQADGPHCPFDERARAVMRVVNEQADRTGKKAMYAFNITGDLDQMRRRHDLVLSLGGTCVMASLNSVGLAGMIELGRFSQLPIHAHRNGWGYLSREPSLGWSYVAWQNIWRLAGADHMHVNGLRNKFCEPDDSVIASARSCLTPMFDSKPCTVMPVFSSGQSARQAPDTYAALGSADLIYAAGGGIMGHPDGPAAGVASLRESWDASLAGIPLAEHAKTHPALAKAIEAYA
ncbi:ribulose-bisphosphate carboxylase large subunit family protein [Azospirillum sp. A29]|uniref:ribulose-bisphosphate carboxylase large subunit family protein n=1 Tax=Azospirillum sp. A29 TaxID=3160606 RepID=UPI00366F5BCB